MPCSPGDSPRNAARRRGGAAAEAGFSLIEVLIALAVLAILGAVTLRGIHESQNTLAEDRWKDTATRLARNLLYEQTLDGKNLSSGGTFSPEHPTMRWSVERHELGAAGGSRSTLTVWQDQGSRRYAVRLETFAPQWTDTRKDRRFQ